jgi:hypothetical protein
MKPMQTKPPTPHLDTLESLTGLARGEYYRNHSRAIRRESLALIRYNANPPKPAV